MQEIPIIVAINTMDISQLSGDLHWMFVKSVLMGAEETPAVTKNLPKELAMLREAVEYEQLMLQIEDNGKFTKLIYDEADKRDKVQTALKSGLRAAMGFGDEKAAAAGKELLQLIKDYHLHARMNIDEHSAQIDSFILDVQNNYTEQLRLTKTTELFESLNSLNESVRNLVIMRDEYKASKKRPKMREVRKQTNAAYRYFVYAVNAYAFVQGYKGFADFIGYVNAVILRYKRYHLHEHVASPTVEELQEIQDTILKKTKKS